MSNQKMIVALLAVVAVLLAVIVGVLAFKPAAVPSVDSAGVTPDTGAPSATTSGAPPAGMPGATASGPFDPAKATKASGEPKAHVDKYFGAIIKGDYKTAFALLPTDKKANGEQAFAEQIKGYGMTKYEIGKNEVKGDSATVEATVQTSGGPFTYVWTFEKYNGAWIVKSRAIGGMGQ